MPRFYFNFRADGVLLEDRQGAELESVEVARNEALRAAREMVSERILHGESIDGEVFEIYDEHGKLIETITFKDTINFH